ncbi:MAG: NAD-dependent epimerase/dehydratase family protein [Deltaproteobacteria bacterium]
MRILITGAAGLIGRKLTPWLERDHELRLGDVRPLAGDARYVRCDVTRPAEVQTAMQGIDAVVHLAIAAGHEGEYEDDEFNQQRFDVNVKGTWNVLEAARRAGVRRFVHTSSLMVVWGYPPTEWVPSDAPARPVGTYAQTKYLAEILCEQAALMSDLSVVCLRIARPIDLDDASWKQRPLRPQWIAFPDLVETYRLAVTATDIKFDIVTVVGESSRRRWDLSRAERVLGYHPRYRLEDLGYTLGDERL